MGDFVAIVILLACVAFLGWSIASLVKAIKKQRAKVNDDRKEKKE